MNDRDKLTFLKRKYYFFRLNIMTLPKLVVSPLFTPFSVTLSNVNYEMRNK